LGGFRSIRLTLSRDPVSDPKTVFLGGNSRIFLQL